MTRDDSSLAPKSAPPARHQPSRVNWQPIETAPKDGSVLLGAWLTGKGDLRVSTVAFPGYVNGPWVAWLPITTLPAFAADTPPNESRGRSGEAASEPSKNDA